MINNIKGVVAHFSSICAILFVSYVIGINCRLCLQLLVSIICILFFAFSCFFLRKRYDVRNKCVKIYCVLQSSYFYYFRCVSANLLFWQIVSIERERGKYTYSMRIFLLASVIESGKKTIHHEKRKQKINEFLNIELQWNYMCSVLKTI